MTQRTIDAWLGYTNPLLRTLARGVRALGHVRRFVLNPRIRSEHLTRLRGGAQHYQGATHTSHDRYPELFAACARELAGIRAPRILSFGCSTGEEVATLAGYMPQAIIVGVDLNRWCLREATRAHPQHRFFHVQSAEFRAEPAFDAIFCMAVFQRTENRLTGTDVALGSFTFERFEAEIARLDARLKPGGLLFLDESDFVFADTTTAREYSPLDFPGNEILQQRPLFDRHNNRVATEYWVHRAFRKLS